MIKEPNYEAIYHNTIPEYIDGLAKNGDKPAISYFTRQQEKVTHTYSQLCSRVRNLARALAALDLEGKHIAIVGENSYDWISAFLAITYIGAVAVCIDTEQPDETIREMIKASDSEAVFVSATFAEMCGESSGVLRGLRLIPMGTGGDAAPENTLDGLCVQGRELESSVAGPRVEGDSTALIAFTSGTTSKQKMVMLSHYNILKNIGDSMLYVDFGKTVFTSLPFYHTYGLTCAVLGSLLRGTHLHINGDLRTAMRDLQLTQPDSMLTVPLMVEAIYNQIWLNAEKSGQAKKLRQLFRLNAFVRKLGISWQSKKLSEIKEKICPGLATIICGGAHLGKKISEDFMLLGILMLQGYGITECSPLIAVNRNDAYKMGSVGFVLPSFELKLEDEEVVVRGPSVMKGYYKEPGQTAEAITDGWFRTGDIGYRDRDGFLFLTGRKKNLIVFNNGKKISPEKLEEMIERIPLVKEVVVHGTLNGESADDVKITASIFPNQQRTAEMSSYEILEALQKEIDAINARLPAYQQIQMVSIREEEFSKTGTKKIKRNLV